MAKKKTTLPPKGTTESERKLRNMGVFSGEPPILDDVVMSDFEQQLFLRVVEGTLAAANKQQPLNLAMNMEVYFNQTTRAGLFLAGMHVRELRNLKEAMKGDLSSTE